MQKKKTDIYDATKIGISYTEYFFKQIFLLFSVQFDHN